MREPARGRCRLSNLPSEIEKEDLAPSFPPFVHIFDRMTHRKAAREGEAKDGLLCGSVQTDERQKECEAQRGRDCGKNARGKT